MAPEPPGPRVFSRAICSTPLPSPFRAPTSIAKYNSETKPELWLADFRLACQLGGARGDDRAIIRQLPLFLSEPPADGSRSSRPIRSTTGPTWSEYSRATSKGPTYGPATRGTSASASRSQEKLFESMLDASRSSAPSCRTSLATTSSWPSSRVPPAEIWCGS